MTNPRAYFENKFGKVEPYIGAIECEDGDVILSFNNYPQTSTMCVPMSAAVDLATQILILANKQMKEAA